MINWLINLQCTQPILNSCPNTLIGFREGDQHTRLKTGSGSTYSMCLRHFSRISIQCSLLLPLYGALSLNLFVWVCTRCLLWWSCLVFCAVRSSLHNVQIWSLALFCITITCVPLMEYFILHYLQLYPHTWFAILCFLDYQI